MMTVLLSGTTYRYTVWKSFLSTRFALCHLSSLRPELPAGLSLMVRVPHHDSEHGGRVRAGLRVSLPSIFLGVVSQPFEGLSAVSLSNRSNHSRTLPSSRAQAEGSSPSNGRKPVVRSLLPN